MKIKKGFLIREVAGKYVAVPVGAKEQTFKGMIQMNRLGAFLWRTLETEHTEEKLIQLILEKYEVTEEKAKADVKRFIRELENAGILEN